jgi:hypothetical protein
MPGIEERFVDWTQGLSPQEARISVFSHIRDIPYALVPQVNDPLQWGASIIAGNKGSCSPKHYLLGHFFAKLGLAVKYATFPFAWEEQALKYPPELGRLAKGLPHGYHAALKAFIEGRWVLVDATWDAVLKDYGFPANNSWDGLSDTRNAVLPLKEVVHERLEERLEFVRLKKALYSEEENKKYSLFVEKFNLWLEQLRSGSSDGG